MQCARKQDPTNECTSGGQHRPEGDPAPEPRRHHDDRVRSLEIYYQYRADTSAKGSSEINGISDKSSLCSPRQCVNIARTESSFNWLHREREICFRFGSFSKKVETKLSESFTICSSFSCSNARIVQSGNKSSSVSWGHSESVSEYKCCSSLMNSTDFLVIRWLQLSSNSLIDGALWRTSVSHPESERR